MNKFEIKRILEESKRVDCPMSKESFKIIFPEIKSRTLMAFMSMGIDKSNNQEIFEMIYEKNNSLEEDLETESIVKIHNYLFGRVKKRMIVAGRSLMKMILEENPEAPSLEFLVLCFNPWRLDKAIEGALFEKIDKVLESINSN